MQDDAELLERIGRGDRDAFEALYARHHEPVLRHVERLVGMAEEAKDIVQEAFLRVWRKGVQWENRGSAAGWIFSIATNLSLNHLKSRRRSGERMLQRALEEDDLPSRLADRANNGPEQAFFRRERIDMVRRHVSELSEEKRAVLDVFLDEGITLREIAERLEIPLGTVKSRMHYASRKLRIDIESDTEGGGQ